MLHLHDTASGTVRPLRRRDEGAVSMYVCGPTVYDLPHLGHGRFTLVFDILRRYLCFGGDEVRYVSNVTDIDDNIIGRATREGRSEADVAAEFEGVWWECMDGLNVLRPTATPHATEYVDDMVAVVGELLERGHAYQLDDGVYLQVATVADYGLLARQPLESLRAGARVEGAAGKRSPLDFVLWKAAKPGEPVWPAPWGAGRPGWHTECVVMSLDLLGEGFDLHGGGQDLAFPHHENERAQAVALGRRFAGHWTHNGWVEVGGQKMSKSLGNFTSLTDLLAQADGRAYRLLVCQSHYRSPIEVTPDTVTTAEAALARLDALARRFDLPAGLGAGGPLVRDTAPAVGADAAAVDRFCAAMDGDLDTARALAQIFDLVTAANSAADSGDLASGARLAGTVAVLCGALGLSVGGPGGEVDTATAELVRQRDAARAAGEWDRADELRRQLQEGGWEVEDGPSGTAVRRS